MSQGFNDQLLNISSIKWLTLCTKYAKLSCLTRYETLSTNYLMRCKTRMEKFRKANKYLTEDLRVLFNHMI